MEEKSKLTEILEKSKIIKIIIEDRRRRGIEQDLGQPVRVDETVLMVERIITILTDRGYMVTIKMEKEE